MKKFEGVGTNHSLTDASFRGFNTEEDEHIGLKRHSGRSDGESDDNSIHYSREGDYLSSPINNDNRPKSIEKLDASSKQSTKSPVSGLAGRSLPFKGKHQVMEDGHLKKLVIKEENSASLEQESSDSKKPNTSNSASGSNNYGDQKAESAKTMQIGLGLGQAIKIHEVEDDNIEDSQGGIKRRQVIGMGNWGSSAEQPSNLSMQLQGSQNNEEDTEEPGLKRNKKSLPEDQSEDLQSIARNPDKSDEQDYNFGETKRAYDATTRHQKRTDNMSFGDCNILNFFNFF